MVSLLIAPPILWLIILVFFALLEAATVNLVSVWFAGGALITLLFSLFSDSLLAQCIVFVAFSVLCLALVRPLVKNHFTPHLHPTNADRFIGMDAIVTEAIDNLSATGQVKVSGQVWSARSDTDTPIPAGTTVTVLQIEGVKVIVQAKKPVAV